ncbi:ABC-2 type transport system permease protein [Kytococcus aerolatus]|uniref:ABC-2 type transport system permease protein n=1 Tax=Kytococcus aerolatus TaxID=592308 RepID=A0A212U7S5_9MICO|nr:ABC transporter permease subunit [Kytococcus aerolatus]SNC74308.1 ABC-2 type transport system permease protein [Kytococcus aerolatus]
MTVALMTWRALARGWRPLLLLALPVGGLALALLLRVASGGVDEVMADSILRDLATAVIVPLTALLVAVNALGNEVDDNSIVHLLSTPTPRLRIILEKVLVVALVAGVLGALTTLGMGVAMGSAEPLPWLVAGGVSGIAYGVVFTALSAWVRQAVLIGALYLVLWEGMLIGLAPRARFLSIHHGALAVAEAMRPDSAPVTLTGLGLTSGVVLLGVAVVASLLLAWWGLRRLRLSKVT